MNNVILQGVDVMDMINFLTNKNSKFQATTLSHLESVLGKDTEQFKQARKIYLDSSNNFLRAVITAIFGDVNA
jgi:hypothetical protein